MKEVVNIVECVAWILAVLFCALFTAADMYNAFDGKPAHGLNGGAVLVGFGWGGLWLWFKRLR